MSNYEVYFNTIYVVESLPAGDWKTGTNLFNHTIEPMVLSQAGLFCFFRSVYSKRELFDTLNAIADECFQNNWGPLLHIECHESEDGLWMGSDEFISWAELKPFLLPLNTQSGLNLLVTLAACSGSNLVKVLLPNDRAPVWGLIGPKERIHAYELLNDYRAFYSELIVSLDARTALEKLNGGQLDANSRYSFIPAEWLFKRAFEEYMIHFGSDSMLKQREDSIISWIANRKALSAKAEQGIRASLKKKLRDHEFFFNKYKEQFFFIDMIPKNANRFSIGYVELRKPAV